MLGILWMQMFHTNSIGMYALLGACALLAASQQDMKGFQARD